MCREDAHIADILVHRKADVVAAEEALQPRFGDVVKQRLRISPSPRHDPRLIVDVGREDLHFRRCAQRVEVLAQQDRDGIDFLAGGAAGHPDSHRVACALALEYRRDDRFFEQLEGAGVTEEIGHPDQQIAEQQRDFVRVLTQLGDVLREARHLQHLHAVAHPPLEALLLVATEVVTDLILQDAIDGLISVALGVAVPFPAIVFLDQGFDLAKIAGVFGEPRRHLLDRQDEIDDACGDRRIWHAGLQRPRTVPALRQRQAAALLDGLDPERAVTAAARQQDSDRGRAARFRKRAQKHVDRLALGLVGAQLQSQLAVHHGHDVIRRTDVQFIRLERRAVCRGLHRHRGVAAEDFNERADMAARKMGDQREAHAGVGGHYAEHTLERLEPTGRGTYSDHWKIALGGHNVTSLARLRPCARAEPRPMAAARQCVRLTHPLKSDASRTGFVPVRYGCRRSDFAVRYGSYDPIPLDTSPPRGTSYGGVPAGRLPMLQKLAEKAAECHRRAREAREAAERSCDSISRTDYENLERRWLLLAESYQLSERVSHFQDEVRKRIAVLRPPDPPNPALPSVKCPNCGKRMRLVQIEPGSPPQGRETATFECTCGEKLAQPWAAVEGELINEIEQP